MAKVYALRESRVTGQSVIYILYWVVIQSSFEKIVNDKSSKEAWQILEKVYKDDNHVKQIKLQTLMCDFKSMRMENRRRVIEYISTVEAIH